MLHKRSRLRAAEVTEVLKGGRSARSVHLNIKFLPGSGPLRAAAVAPKAVAKGAVERNRLRRALYRALLKVISPTNTGRAVVMVKKIPEGSLTPTFAAELESLLP